MEEFFTFKTTKSYFIKRNFIIIIITIKKLRKRKKI